MIIIVHYFYFNAMMCGRGSEPGATTRNLWIKDRSWSAGDFTV